MASRSFWSDCCTSKILRELCGEYNDKSSANKRTSFFIISVIPFKYSKAKSGPKTEPWGHPALIVNVGEKASPTFTLCLRSLRYDPSHCKSVPFIPNSLSHLINSPLCQIRSKNFEMSKYIAVNRFPGLDLSTYYGLSTTVAFVCRVPAYTRSVFERVADDP